MKNNDAEMKSLESRIKATEIFAVRTFKDVPKCWHKYLCVKLELLRREPFLSYDSIDYQRDFFRTIGEMAKKYPVDKNEQMYIYYTDRFESARTYQEKRLWSHNG